MALNLFVRRASSSGNRCGAGLQFLQSVRFSTVTNNNYARMLESDIDSSEQDSDAIISHCPFKVRGKKTSYGMYYLFRLETMYKDEKIRVELEEPVIQSFGDMRVDIVRGHQEHRQEIRFDMLASKDQFKIQRIDTSNRNGEHLENMEEFVRSKGLQSGMINMFFEAK